MQNQIETHIEVTKKLQEKWLLIDKIYADQTIKANFSIMGLFQCTLKWNRKLRPFQVQKRWIKKWHFINQSLLRKERKWLIQKV